MIDENFDGSKRIPLISADEYDALTKAKRFYAWRSGDRAKVKRGYWKRFRSGVCQSLKGEMSA